MVIFTEKQVKKRKLPTSWKKNNKKSGLTEEKTENAQPPGYSGVFLSIDWKELSARLTSGLLKKEEKTTFPVHWEKPMILSSTRVEMRKPLQIIGNYQRSKLFFHHHVTKTYYQILMFRNVMKQ